MATLRIALANLEYPTSPDDSIRRAVEAIRRGSDAGAEIIAFPECYVPGYRAPTRSVPPPDAAFLERAWAEIAQAAGASKIAVVLGTERLTDRGLLITALVIHRDGTIAGFQDKTQVDPSEEGIYVIADGDRKVFESSGVKFGVAICHEGWRYPETVRSPVKRGAQLVFHPHFHWADGDSFRPTTFADPRNSFHEKAALCRAAENTCFFATINYATEGAPTTSAVVRPDGTLLAHQPYGQAGLLIADIELDEATRLLAARCKDY
ncbi:MAG TPA: carbon-nitrogen hydrolase family protein [Vicinamibacterales bacterium]|nr:carbon-nitrogen hydrolase family protein [Vicinamibacterales bacterium]